MAEWIVVKVQNLYMIRKKHRINDKWDFLKITLVIHRTVIHCEYTTLFKWIAKRKLNKLIKSEKGESLYKKRRKEGGCVII